MRRTVSPLQAISGKLWTSCIKEHSESRGLTFIGAKRLARALGSGRARVADFVKERGLKVQIVEFADTTRNSALAAKALGCSVAEIAKSVVFSAGQGIVVVISGDKRVDTTKLSRLVGGETIAASAGEVKLITGYPAGGVPPFPHNDGVRVLLDSSLARFREVWAAGGLPNSVMKLATADLVATIGAPFVEVAQG